MKEVPIWEKSNLSLEKAAALFCGLAISGYSNAVCSISTLNRSILSDMGSILFWFSNFLESCDVKSALIWYNK